MGQAIGAELQHTQAAACASARTARIEGHGQWCTTQGEGLADAEVLLDFWSSW